MERNDLLIGGKAGEAGGGAGSSGRINAARQLGLRGAQAAVKSGRLTPGELRAAGKGRGFYTAAERRAQAAGNGPSRSNFTLP
jgi:hypothetical protein